MNPSVKEFTLPLQEPLFRGEKRLRIALVGPNASGKSTIFNAVSSTAVHCGELAYHAVKGSKAKKTYIV